MLNQEDQTETNRKQTRTTTKTIQTTLDGGFAEAKCQYGKICKNVSGLNIHQSRSGCGRRVEHTHLTATAGETQEDPSQEAHHTARNLSVSESPTDRTAGLVDDTSEATR